MNGLARLCARTSAVALIASAPFATSAFAAGYAVKETSAALQGVAYAGAAAGGEDVSAMFANPAAIAFQPRKYGQPYTPAERDANVGVNAAAGVSVLYPAGEFTNIQATTASATDLGVPAPAAPLIAPQRTINDTLGNSSAASDDFAYVPASYGSFGITDKLAVGLGVTSHFGLVTDYGESWAGRYHATRSELVTIHANPVISYKPTPKIAIAAGPVITYAKATLKNSVDFQTIGTALVPARQLAGGVPPANVASIPGGTDGRATVKGDDVGFGFTAGILVQPTDRFRFGIGYRSEIDLDLEGDFDIDYANNPVNGFIGGQVGLTDQSASASATLPMQVNIGASFDVTPKLTLSAEADWTDWSAFDTLIVKGAQGQDITETPQRWDDSWFLSLGGTYDVNEKLRLRGGIAYDQGASSDEFRTPRIPDSDRFWLTAGFGYQVTDHMTLNAAYTYVNVDDNNVDLNVANDPTGAARGNLKADGDATVHLVYIGGTIKF